jgi:hypothetical protein
MPLSDALGRRDNCLKLTGYAVIRAPLAPQSA